MSRRRARAGISLAIALGVLLVGLIPGVALSAEATAPGTAPALPPPGGFQLKASNGYTMDVVAEPAREGKPAVIGIFLMAKAGAAFYSAPAKVTKTSIQANLGRLGEIAVTFVPSGQKRIQRVGCGGNRHIRFDSGSYEGTISFHGEEGFTTVEASTAPGSIAFFANLICGAIGGVTGGPSIPGAQLEAFADGSQEGPHVKVVKNRPNAPAHFEAGAGEVREGIAIDRLIGIVAPPSSFKYDAGVKRATVHPPSPFSGTARFYRDGTPGGRWTGNLTVDLPGRAGVKLTGASAQATLAHAHWNWHAVR